MLKKTVRLVLIAVCLTALLWTLALGVGAASASAEQAPVGAAYGQLNNFEKMIYRYLREQLNAVADGSRSSTEFQVDDALLAEWASQGLKITWTSDDFDGGNVPQGPVLDAFAEQFSFEKIVRALVHDCPYTLYWYDKTAGAHVGCSMQTYTVGDVRTKISISQLLFRFSVSSAYRAEGDDSLVTSIDPQKTKAASAVLEKASAIVAYYADVSDYAKLVGYRDEICALVVYNHDAAADSYTDGYGNPWQLVYVFDGDPDTSVVCEGYAKAFQFLCDLTDFSGDVTCYSVNGTMAGGTGAGAHMWNVVTMDDGKSYLVDVTNSDQDSVGQDGGLFLAGSAGSLASGYTFSVDSAQVSYLYTEDTCSFWNNGVPLVLASVSYQPPNVLIECPDRLIYDGGSLTAGQRDADILYLYEGSADLANQFVLSHTWYADADGERGEKLTDSPTNAGAYWIVVSAKRGTEEYVAQKQIVISPATPAFTIPTNLTATYGDTLESVTLPQGFTWKDPSLVVGNAGNNSFRATYTPADRQNYTTVEIEVNLSVAQKDISGMTPEIEQFPTYNNCLQTIEAYLPSFGEVGIAYTVSGNQATDVGIYVLELTGIGNFCGTVTAEWKILPDISSIEGITPETVTVNDKAAIERVKASIKSDAAKSEWAEVLTACEALLAAIDEQEHKSEESTDTKDTESDDKRTSNETNAGEVFGCVAVLTGEPWLLIGLLAAGVIAKKKHGN